MHHWASEFNNSIPSSATDGMSSQASYKHRVSQFVSKVESSITETTQEVSSPASCSKGGWTLKPVQVAQGSCQVFKTSKDWHFKASLGNLLSILCSSDWKIFCLYPVGNSPFSVYGHCLFSHLPRSLEAAVKSAHSHLSHLQAVEAPLPWPLLTPTMVVPTGLTPVCQCLFSDRKALSLQPRCQPLMPGCAPGARGLFSMRIGFPARRSPACPDGGASLFQVQDFAFVISGTHEVLFSPLL